MTATLRRFKALIYLLVIAFGLTTTWQYRGIIVETVSAHSTLMLFMISSGLIQLHLQSKNFRDLLDTPSNKTHMDWLGLWALSSLSNYIAPFQAGIAIRSVILKLWNIPIQDTLRATLRQVHLSLWGALLLASIGAYFSSTITFELLPWIGLLASCLWLGAMFIRLPHTSSTGKLNSWLISIWHQPTHRQIALILINYLLTGGILVILYQSLDAPLNLADGILLSTVVTVSALFSILPANIGVQELLFWYASQLIGLSAEMSVVVPVILRLSHIGTCTLAIVLAKVSQLLSDTR